MQKDMDGEVYERLTDEKSEGDIHAAPGHTSRYNYGTRKCRDSLWSLVFLACFAFCVIGGLYGFVNRNPNFYKYDKDYVNDIKHCPLKGDRSLLEEDDELGILITRSWWLVFGGIAGSFFMGLAYLTLFRKYAHFMVSLTVNFQIALPAVVGVGLLFSGAALPALGMLLVACLFAVVFYLFRTQLDLCTKLLAVTSTALKDNPGMILFVVLLKLALLLISIPLLVLLAVSFQNGALVRNPAIAELKGSTCLDSDGAELTCCIFENDSWVLPYVALSAFVLLWTLKLGFEIRLFTITGCVSQWYFAPYSDMQVTKGSLVRSFRQALGPQFGSLCLGSLVLTVVQVIQQLAEQVRNGNSGNFISYLISSFASCIMEIVKFFTRFATVRLAITGESFYTAAHEAYDMLTRNLMSAYSVWWIPPMVLRMAAFVTSALWGILCFFISWGVLAPEKEGMSAAAIVGVVSFISSMVVLAFFITMMINIVEVVYFCYAMDKDACAVTHPEIHEVYMLIPQKDEGAVVEQPGGNLFYGVPQAL